MSLSVEVGGLTVQFHLWRPGLVLIGPISGLDSETEEIEPGKVPRPVIATASDGITGYIINPKDFAAFLTAHEGMTFVLHNAAFDLAVLSRCGINIFSLIESGRWWDTGLLYRLLKLADRGACHGAWSLDHVCNELLKLVLPKDLRSADGRDVRTTFGRFLKSDGTLDHSALLQPKNKIYLEYAAGDPVATVLLAYEMNNLAERLFGSSTLDIFNPSTYESVGPQDGVDVATAWRQFGFLTHHIQLKGSVALDAISRHGMHVDSTRVANVIKELDAALKVAKETLKKCGWEPGTGSVTKFNSIMTRVEKELGEPLPRNGNDEDDDIDVPSSPKHTNAFSRRADDLEEYRTRSAFIDTYLQFQEQNKLRNTFMEPMKKAEIVVRGRFNSIVNTGRTSCSAQKNAKGERAGLNLQNLPKGSHVRECLGAGPGKYVLACDYSTIELGTFAQHCLKKYGFSKMAEAIHLGADLHAVYAAHRKGIDLTKYERWDKKTLMPLLGADAKKHRDRAKPVNFGFPGGLGAKSFVDFARTSYGVEMTVEEAQQEKDAWMERWSEAKLHLESDDLKRLTKLFPHLWANHPTAQNQNRPDELPWPVFIFKGVLMGRKKTVKSKRFFTSEEIDWAWNGAAEIVPQLPHLSETQRTVWMTRVRERIPGQDLWSALTPRQRFVATLTGRLRGYPAYCAARKTVFQGLAADGAKLALYRLHSEKFEIINFIHDEVLVALAIDADCTVEAKRVETVMIEEMQLVTPDIPVSCEYALMRHWHKGAEAMFVDGKLVPVKPIKIDGKTNWAHDKDDE